MKKYISKNINIEYLNMHKWVFLPTNVDKYGMNPPLSLKRAGSTSVTTRVDYLCAKSERKQCVKKYTPKILLLTNVPALLIVTDIPWPMVVSIHSNVFNTSSSTVKSHWTG